VGVAKAWLANAHSAGLNIKNDYYNLAGENAI